LAQVQHGRYQSVLVLAFVKLKWLKPVATGKQSCHGSFVAVDLRSGGSNKQQLQLVLWTGGIIFRQIRRELLVKLRPVEIKLIKSFFSRQPVSFH